ncbi:MAG: DUF2277 domain-containing protein [Bryobacteraceae bacterium]|jgi:hypothetical protein
MCRSIKILRRPEAPATAPEISAAALQFVRKVSGFRKPSKANQEAFEAAVRDVAAATERLLGTVTRSARPLSDPRESPAAAESGMPARPAE